MTHGRDKGFDVPDEEGASMSYGREQRLHTYMYRRGSTTYWRDCGTKCSYWKE